LACDNLSRKPATVTVTSLDAAGAAEITSADHCIGSPLAAGATCQVVLPADTDGRSTVVADTGKIRAAIEVFGPSPFPLVTVAGLHAPPFPSTRWQGQLGLASDAVNHVARRSHKLR